VISSIKDLLRSSKKNHVKPTHCFLHPEVFVSETVGEGLKQVLVVAVNMVSFIKQCSLKSRIFATLYESMQKDHATLFQHTEVRGLSRGKVLSKVFLMREELQLFFKDNNKESFSNFLIVTKWLLKLAYLANIYQHLNTLNSSMQGLEENILNSSDQPLAFKNIIHVWKESLSSGIVEVFPLLLQIRCQ
jgi:hypothetical protein